ncbi:tRNA dimethylallyltransferase [Desulfamplus magnetovallimortis]|uniref:tRNA dimethylallyltransferase n=1 Tax=Desulfamplus magnetovallimortis TaxID=1246637 RepID=A0A1W1HDE3_9BACT|nr:tRNA (adenosine(37)-N6)-dimethylallyltransferase MiaA [Desulfamplus magnetovallimortis]SLM30499.1 tRNA dimethylallyltransferase [Desulfamplus magnetovallimortis]
MKKIIIICGPTAVGKTSFAIHLAEKCNGEIIGADSMQIYKYMDIGTAKPDMDERQMVPHHLIDFLDPDKDFDAGQYVAHADSVIEELYSRSKVPVVVGGTGFYIKALMHGLFRERTADKSVLDRLEKEKEERGNLALYEKLAMLDPESALRIHPNDSFRVIRALEVLEVTGKTISSYQNQHGFTPQRYTALKICLNMERSLLYHRIEKRVDQMMSQDLVNEVRALLRMGYSCDLKAMQSIGYRHVCEYLNQGVSFDETVRLLKRDTRRYAKRQLTWFRNDRDIIWMEPWETKRAIEAISGFLLSVVS